MPILKSYLSVSACADDGYKVKLFDPDAKAVVAVYLGPTFGGPLQQLLMFKCVLLGQGQVGQCVLAET